MSGVCPQPARTRQLFGVPLPPTGINLSMRRRSRHSGLFPGPTTALKKSSKSWLKIRKRATNKASAALKAVRGQPPPRRLHAAPLVLILYSRWPTSSSVWSTAASAGKSWTPLFRGRADTLSGSFSSTRNTAGSGSGRTPAQDGWGGGGR